MYIFLLSTLEHLLLFNSINLLCFTITIQFFSDCYQIVIRFNCMLSALRKKKTPREFTLKFYSKINICLQDSQIEKC